VVGLTPFNYPACRPRVLALQASRGRRTVTPER
jgi:hypothetical protein